MEFDYSTAKLQTEKDHKKFCDLNLATEREEDIRFRVKCDGCGGVLEPGDKFITGIESCCGGGCTRNLCERCIIHSYNLLKGN